jgi:hypothetical protein
VLVLIGLMTSGSDNGSGILLFFPLTAMIFITVAILVLSFLKAVQRTVSPGQSKNRGILGAACLLVGVPLLGLYYATHGQNRHSLAVISIAGLCAGTIALLVLIGKRTQ